MNNYDGMEFGKRRFTAAMMEEFTGWFIRLPEWMNERYTSAPGDLYVVNSEHALDILYVEEKVNSMEGFHLIATDDFPLIVQHMGGSWADFAKIVYGF